MKNQRSRLSRDDANDLLRMSGLRKTIARTNLLQCLAGLESPKTQAEICDLLAVHGFDSSTIFRSLADLTEVGLVIRIDAGDRIWRFEMRDRDPNGKLQSSHHPHAICTNCGQVCCLQTELISSIEQLLKGWTICDLNFRGVCTKCQSNIITDDPT